MIFSTVHSIAINNSTGINLLSHKEFVPENFLGELLPNEIKKLETFKNENKKREFIATRILRNKIFGKDEITYDTIGAPHIGAEKYLSISHTANIVGIAVSDYKIGFDLEPIGTKVLRLYQKFLHNDELEIFNTSCELEMTMAWSAKETLYKLAGRKKIIFKDELRLHKEGDLWFGTIYNPSTILQVPLRVFDSGTNVLTINSAPCEIKQRNLY